MKLLIIGGSGTIGKKVSSHFAKKHEVIVGGRSSGDVTVGIADSKSMHRSPGAQQRPLLWCGRWCRTHRSPSEFHDALWINRHPAPQFYSNYCYRFCAGRQTGTT